jgi:signal transduction histidine kinase
MQVQHEQTQEELIQSLQRQVHELTTANLFLQDQLARKEQFTAMIAHELRGPLSPIINYAQMLARHACLPKAPEVLDANASTSPNTAIQRQTRIIVSQAKRLARLVDDLLDASRLTSGQFTLLRTQCDFVALAQDLVEQLRPVAPYHTFVLQVPDAPVIGNWDGGRLQQALGNLLDNAIKYSDEGTTITVHVWTTQDKVHVTVHNQGVSIPSNDIGSLFRPYARIQATSGARQGSGLGLYITKSIIEAHQGTLRLEPHAEETPAEERQGTTFSFELPLISPA